LALTLLPLFFMVGPAGCAHEQAATHSRKIATANPATIAVVTNAPAATVDRREQIRTECIQGRRLICGRVLKIYPDGLVVDSGYTDLLRPSLTQSWLIPGTATATREPTSLERQEPEAPCFGLVFLTDIPKRPKVNTFDYVVIIGYPAGPYFYEPTSHVQRKVRKFSAGLNTAVQLIFQAEKNQPPSNLPNR
jgi:hypothetical protein